MEATFRQVNIPTTQSFLTYGLVAATYGVYHIWHHGLRYFKSRIGLWCIFLALTDFVATFLTIKAYQYTSLVSIQLLDCMAIPTIMILSCIIFKVRYRWLHYVAVVICLSGVVAMVFVDSHKNQSLKGDFLVICAAVLYGVNNTCLEWLAKDIGCFIYLGIYCWFGLAISGVQVALLEREALCNLPVHDPYFYLTVLGFVSFLFIFLSLMPLIMIRYNAAVANLNLLAADVYSAVAGYVIFSIKFSELYILSIALIICGVLLYIHQTHLSEQNSSPSNPSEGSQETVLVLNNENTEVE